MPLLDLSEPGNEIAVGTNASSELHEQGGMRAFDGLSGENLVPEMVRAVRIEEMAYLRRMKVHEKSSLFRSACWP